MYVCAVHPPLELCWWNTKHWGMWVLIFRQWAAGLEMVGEGWTRERERVGGKAGTLIVFWALERKRVCIQVKLGVGVCLRPLNCLLAFSHSSRQIGMRKDGGNLSLSHLHPLKLHFRKDDLHHGPMCTWAPKMDHKHTFTNTQINMCYTPEPEKCFSVSALNKHTHIFMFRAGVCGILCFPFCF